MKKKLTLMFHIHIHETFGPLISARINHAETLMLL